MLTPPPDQRTIFNADYAILGEYVQDDQRVPYYNPPTSNMMIEPGEPVVVQWDGGTHVMMAQGPIRPGETGFLVRYFKANLPCNFSANVIQGDAVTWDQTNKQLILPGDIATNDGFPCGNAIWIDVPDGLKNKQPEAVDGNGRAICATTSSTWATTLVMPGAVTVNNSPTIL